MTRENYYKAISTQNANGGLYSNSFTDFRAYAENGSILTATRARINIFCETLGITGFGGFMNKDTADYLNYNKNVTKDEFVIGRERSGKRELIMVSLPDTNEPLYALWNSRKTAKKYKKDDKCDIAFKEVQPKGTGGKETYVMLMVSEFDRAKLSLEAGGLMLSLIKQIDWHTGKITDHKSPMTKQDISVHSNVNMTQLNKIIKELTNKKVLYYKKSERAYFVNRKFIKKGGGYENKI